MCVVNIHHQAESVCPLRRAEPLCVWFSTQVEKPEVSPQNPNSMLHFKEEPAATVRMPALHTFQHRVHFSLCENENIETKAEFNSSSKQNMALK